MKDYWYMGMCILYPMTFIFSIKFTRKVNSFEYMRGFYWYPLVALIIVIIFVLRETGQVSGAFFTRANLLSGIFHYFFLGNFISKAINILKYQIVFKILYYFFLIVTICSAIFSSFVLSYKGLSLSVANIGLVVLSLFYYNSLFDEEHISNLYKEPSFWVITGTVLGMSLNIPFHALGNRISIPFQSQIFDWITIFAIWGFYIMHLSFIKASFLCSAQTLKK